MIKMKMTMDQSAICRKQCCRLHPAFLSALVADFGTEESKHAVAVEDEYEGNDDGEAYDEDSNTKHLFHHLKASLRTSGNF
jgi:hypothetical protein